MLSCYSIDDKKPPWNLHLLLYGQLENDCGLIMLRDERDNKTEEPRVGWFEGWFDGITWYSIAGYPCRPTHWALLPEDPNLTEFKNRANY